MYSNYGCCYAGEHKRIQGIDRKQGKCLFEATRLTPSRVATQNMKTNILEELVEKREVLISRINKVGLHYIQQLMIKLGWPGCYLLMAVE